ncbi:MAG: phosphate ABC transporter, permease protein PstA [Ilumatobacter coccineus]|uniref:Phosphate transport system permease protein PstA n=1 Tax=Ilumatobacter coccineus TaxID=467094 RepID=A0A2G6KFH1_9ACTN|nr:MAG: phosphate ABC transporter, permease protein PstA [Ilumatobacter coccineus]
MTLLSSERRGPVPDHLSSGKVTTAVNLTIVAISVILAAAVVTLTTGFKIGWIFLLAIVIYVAGIYLAASVLEDSRKAKDRLATVILRSSFVLVIVPLVSVTWTVVTKGLARFDTTFFTHTMALSLDELISSQAGEVVGGAQHAIVGTLIVTGLATVFSVPIGLFTAIYLVEYGKGRLARSITAIVDVMTGIPSIVAGLFAYALFALIFGPGTLNGLSGAIALTTLMTPVVVRSTEEMLRLVPNELREASYALGVQKWLTIIKVVLPTGIAGILTGVTLAIARVIGETAPLLIAAGMSQGTTINPLAGRMTTLPVFTYLNYKFPSQPTGAAIDRAWAAALTLVVIIAILFTTARLLSNLLKPAGLR